VSKGIFEDPSHGRFGFNGATRELLEEPARLGLDLEGIGGRMAHDWATLPAGVRPGRPITNRSACTSGTTSMP
jgi:hypothetical protein